MSIERISNRRRFEKVRAPATFGAPRGKDQSPPWHRRPAGGIRRYQRFRTPSDNESPNFDPEFNGDVDDNYAVERTAKSFPPRGPTENPFRYGFKHEVLKVSAEEVQTETGETQVYFKAVAIVGDFNGNVGLGVDVAMKPTRAAKGAITVANDNIVSIRRGHWGAHKHGLPHTIYCKVNSAIDDLQVRVNPAPRGTGITGPPLARKMLEYAGVQDAYVIIRGEEPELATLCQTILSAVKDTFTIFQDKILQAYNVRRKEDMVTYNKSKVTDLLPFDQPKGSCGNIGLFIPDMIEDAQAKGSVVEGAQPGISQTFSDFVPGAKAHLTANGLDGDEDKENASLLTGSLTIEDAATDAEDADKYIEEINKISIQLDDCEVKENATAEVELNSGSFETDGFQMENDFGELGDETEAAAFNEYVEAGFNAWPPADFMGGGDNNAMQSAFDKATDVNHAMGSFSFGAQVPPAMPLQPRKRNPIPIIDPNENGADGAAIEA